MMKKSRFAAVVLGAAMLAGLTACGESSQVQEGTQAAASQGETESSEAAQSGAETGASQEEKDPIEVATKPMTEQYILGEMLKILIEDSTDYTVNVTQGIGGGTSNIQPAMEAGEFDLYPEYTSSGYVMVLDHSASGVSDEEIWETLQKEYHEKYRMAWVGLYGFNNTFTVAVRKDIADQYHLKTTSDLAPVAGELVFGGNPDYIEREDGFGLLCDTYGLKFKNVMDIDIGLKYQAMANGEIDVTNGFTTDAQLGSGDVVALEDDLKLQANYYCSTVVREDALEEYPGLEEALMKMDGILTDTEMAELNYKLEIEGMDEHQIALDFLTEKGLITDEE